jgi:hypothetical protein
MRPRHTLLVAAAVVYAIAAWIPFGHELLYPLSLFTTWVHEMGHGLAALAVGGTFERLQIFRNGSGLASCGAAHGWPQAVVSLGGLLAPPIVGAAILAFAHGPRRARGVLVVLALALVASVAVYVRSPAGMIAMPVVAVALAAAAWWGQRVVVAQVLGVLLALDTATRMVSYVFMSSVEIDGVKRTSDIQDVADNLGGSYLMWGALVTVFALGLLAVGVWWAWRRDEA